MKLNSDQQKAVSHKQGPLLIVAGAGTGKTAVITERIKHLLQVRNIDPQQIFAATFTQKASEEMVERLDTVMPLGYREPWIGTFHSLCDRLLRQEGLEVGLDPGFTIMTQTDQWIFLKEHLFEFNLDYYRPLGNPSKFITALIKFFSRLQDELITTDDMISFAANRTKNAGSDEETIAAQRISELAQAFIFYQTIKVAHSVMDFGDLISKSIELLQKRPNLLAQYQRLFAHILVDEFQDTNTAQYQLIKLLAPAAHNPNLVVVGDDDQAIYRFRGASVVNILQFKQDYPQAKEVILSQNYRSTQSILEHSYRSIIKNNPERLEIKLKLNKKLTSLKTPTDKPVVMRFSTVDEEVDWTIKKIINLVSLKDVTYKDIAILTRSNNQLDPYVQALKRRSLPYQLIANRGLFDQPEIQNLILFLKAITNKEDDQNLFQASQIHVFNLNQTVLLEALYKAKRYSTSLWSELYKVDDSKIQKFLRLITHYQGKLKDSRVTNLLYDFINTSHYLKTYLEHENIENQLKIKNINLFFDKLKTYEATSDSPGIIPFLQTLELWLEAGENPGQAQIKDIDTINLMTIHAAKGLEFEAVFVGSLVAGRFPSSNRKDPITVPEELIKSPIPEGDIHVQEERRLFYVALTRAKEHLYLTYATDYGGKKQWKPSGFIKETGLPIESIEKDLIQLPLVNFPKAKPPQYLQGGHYQLTQVSYSKIDTFKLCPLKYKYRYLLQIPARPHHSLSFGRTIHETLHQFHQHQMQGKLLSQKELIDLYGKNFVNEGYDSPKHKQARFDSGRQAMIDYYHKHNKLLGSPKLLEQSFKMKFGDVTFTGKIDRIDQNKTGEYEIVDYKTGSHKDQKQVDRDEQLTFYGLATRDVLGVDASSMSLYFLEDGGEKITTTRTSKQLDTARDKLHNDINTIKKSDFPAKPSPHTCGFCEFRSLCPFAAK
jgi:DNA helicase II / ATP-dependent DNA helicase PcrA